MKWFFIVIFIMANERINSQTWQTIYANDLGTNAFVGGIGGIGFTKKFKINPYDNSIWTASANKTLVLKEGELQIFDYLNTPLFHQTSEFYEFEFTSGYSYVVDYAFGLYKYDGNTWSSVYLGMDGCKLASDADTIWMGKMNGNFVKSYDGFATTGNTTVRRFASRDGKTWISSTAGNDVIGRYVNGSNVIYSPDTSKLLDWRNYDFKFAKKTDTLYVSGDLGFSLAHNETFIDTITAGNSVNMPSGKIIEFEFDDNDNIWALFGNTSYYSSTLAYYDQPSKTWTQFYNSLNSPIDFTKRITIELDTLGNLWVANSGMLHVLKINPPDWLEAFENQAEDVFTIYPNPVEDELTISLKDYEIESLEIVDLSGKLICESKQSNHFSAKTLQSGVYFIRVLKDSGVIVQKKFIKK